MEKERKNTCTRSPLHIVRSFPGQYTAELAKISELPPPTFAKQTSWTQATSYKSFPYDEFFMQPTRKSFAA